MEISTINFIYSNQVFDSIEADVFYSEDLPWTFGDCYWRLIRSEWLIRWLEEHGDLTEWDSALAILRQLPANTFISLGY